MIKAIIVAIVFMATLVGGYTIARAQTPSPTPDQSYATPSPYMYPTPSPTMIPQGAPRTGFGGLAR